MKSLLNNSNLTINLVDLAADSITSDNITSQTISATATTESVSTSTGSIICSGGIGVAKNLNVGGAINATGSISGSILSGPVSTSSLTLTGVAPSIKVEATNRLTFGLYSTNFGSFAPILIQNSDDIGSYPVSASLTTAGGLHVEKSVNIAGTTDSTSTSTGAIICAGGAAIAKSIYANRIYAGTPVPVSDYNSFLSTTTHWFSGTNNTGDGSTVAIFDPTYSQSNTGGFGGSIGFYGQYYDYGSDFIGLAGKIRGITGGAYGGALYLDAAWGGAVYNSMIVRHSAVEIPLIFDSTSTNTGSFICSGGVGVAKNLYVGGVITGSSTNRIGDATTADTSNSSVIVNGTLTLNNGTSNTIFMSSSGYAVPSFTNRSSGTKIVLFPGLTGSSVDYAIGVAGNTTWISAPTSADSVSFYNGTTNTLAVTGTSMSINMTTQSTSTTTGAIVCAGGLAVAKDVNIAGIITKGGGSFLIDHPDPTKTGRYKLRHSFVESNTRGDNIYRYKVTTVNKKAVIDLPSYFQYLNENAQALISPVKKLCACCAFVDEELNQVVVESAFDTEFHVLVIGTRKDPLAMNYWGKDKSEEEEIKLPEPVAEPEPKDSPMIIPNTLASKKPKMTALGKQGKK